MNFKSLDSHQLYRNPFVCAGGGGGLYCFEHAIGLGLNRPPLRKLAFNQAEGGYLSPTKLDFTLNPKKLALSRMEGI